MGCGVLEPKTKEAHAPGTAILNEDVNAAALAAFEGVDLSTLERDPTRPDIVLVPQPAGADDPLRWSRAKKHLYIFSLVFGTVLCGALGPLVAASVPLSSAGHF